MHKFLFLFLLLFVMASTWADIPATPVMTLYRFNGSLEIPYYDIDTFQISGPSRPAGTLAQGTSLIPCLVIREGHPLTDHNGTPYVGFHIVVNSRTATPASTEIFKKAVANREHLRVPHHHCDHGVRHVMSVRNLYALKKAPFFDPPLPNWAHDAPDGAMEHHGKLDRIVRAFHNSAYCAAANQRLIGRRTALQRAWQHFIDAHLNHWPQSALNQAKQLDYAMRTAIFEGHLDRGCSAYGACERNIIALSLRNRARGNCSKRQGCRFEGDYQSVATRVSQYNI